MMNKVFTITQLISYIKNLLSNDFILSNITVSGEIGNFTNHFSGHWYFTLKDEKSLINCCMFKGYNHYVDFLPKNGDKVILSGNVNIFEKSGQLQIVATSLSLDGEGDFYAQFEKTKNKLAPLGYFDAKYKKAIPTYPNRIGVVTGANTAALQDIKITLAKRWPVELVQFNAIVQGKEAIVSINNALKLADEANCDVILLARGGGSVDDLWCFNDESIAKTIFNMNTPVISGIGHEIDTTICDLVADLRAATPTAAATLATPDLFEVKDSVKNLTNRLISSMNNNINNKMQLVDYDINTIKTFESILLKLKFEVNEYQNYFKLAFHHNLQEYSKETNFLINSIYHNSSTLFNNTSNSINNYHNRMFNALKVSLFNKTNLLNKYHANIVNSLKVNLMAKESDLKASIIKLDSLSPLKTLARGYIISYQDDNIIKETKNIDVKKPITLRYSDGIVNVKVLED